MLPVVKTKGRWLSDVSWIVLKVKAGICVLCMCRHEILQTIVWIQTKRWLGKGQFLSFSCCFWGPVVDFRLKQKSAISCLMWEHWDSCCERLCEPLHILVSDTDRLWSTVNHYRGTNLLRQTVRCRESLYWCKLVATDSWGDVNQDTGSGTHLWFTLWGAVNHFAGANLLQQALWYEVLWIIIHNFSDHRPFLLCCNAMPILHLCHKYTKPQFFRKVGSFVWLLSFFVCLSG